MVADIIARHSGASTSALALDRANWSVLTAIILPSLNSKRQAPQSGRAGLDTAHVAPIFTRSRKRAPSRTISWPLSLPGHLGKSSAGIAFKTISAVPALTVSAQADSSKESV